MRKRNCRVQVRLDNKEYQAFMKRVKKTGLSQEVYLRHLISGLVPQEAPPSEYFDFMKELYRVGNNLNQVAQKAHVLNVIDVQRYDRRRQKRETHPILRSEYSIIEGEEEFIPYLTQLEQPKKKREMER